LVAHLVGFAFGFGVQVSGFILLSGCMQEQKNLPKA
jgi:hypothetical protein